MQPVDQLMMVALQFWNSSASSSWLRLLCLLTKVLVWSFVGDLQFDPTYHVYMHVYTRSFSFVWRKSWDHHLWGICSLAPHSICMRMHIRFLVHAFFRVRSTASTILSPEGCHHCAHNCVCTSCSGFFSQRMHVHTHTETCCMHVHICIVPCNSPEMLRVDEYWKKAPRVTIDGILARQILPYSCLWLVYY